jgi:Universal stress protein family
MKALKVSNAFLTYASYGCAQTFPSGVGAMSLSIGEHPSLVHPTNYEPGGALAFAHAARLALRGHYSLSLLNIATEELGRRHSGVREVIDLLARWKMLPPGPAGAESLERDLGLSVVGIALPADDARAGVIDYLDNCRCDLAVIATRQHRGLSRWLERSLADRTLRRGATLALLMRENARGFVDPATGAMRLERILVAAESRVDLGPALRRIDDFVDILGFPVDVQLLHIGGSADGLRLPQDGRERRVIVREGPVAEAILETARRVSADVIALPTSRKSGVIAALRGSVTAELLDDGRWPLLSVPAAA